MIAPKITPEPLDLTSRFLTKNRTRMQSTPVRVPLGDGLKMFSSLSRTKKDDKRGKSMRERKNSTQSEAKPKRRSVGVTNDKMNQTVAVASPDGMTQMSVRRLRRMRESRENIASVLRARQE